MITESWVMYLTEMVHLSHGALFLVLCVAALTPVTAAASTEESMDCDVVVAGGSTASLAAALTAAEAAPDLTVCFLEASDWPGGQVCVLVCVCLFMVVCLCVCVSD